MSVFSMRWYYQSNVEQWEKLEAKGKLGPLQTKLLAFWREAKKSYPNLKSIASYGGLLVVEDTGE